ncbi:MAG: IS110 family transposase [Burkholderiales bacterium]|jgi:transposase
MQNHLHVAIDIGSVCHRVAIGLDDGAVIDEFDCPHTPLGLSNFFKRVQSHEHKHAAQVAVAMEGFGGYARPLDSQVLAQGWSLYSINNLKFARFKEIFPAPAKTDAIDAKRMLELMRLRDRVPMAQAVLQEVAPVDALHQQMKAVTRRRKQLVFERMKISQRMQAELQGAAPGLLAITGQADNLWFLNFLTCRESLAKLKTVRRASLLKIAGIGVGYAAKIQAWQQSAAFAPPIDWIGPMIQADAKRILELRDAINALDESIAVLVEQSTIAQRLMSMPGFGNTTAGEVASEIGNIARFRDEASLAIYLGVAPLDRSSGKRVGAKLPRQINPRARDAMLIVTIHHMATVATSRAYYDRKRAQGKTHMQATRALARHLVRVLFSMLKQNRDYRLPAVSA